MEVYEFIAFIKKKREDAFLLQKDIAKKIPISKTTYCKIENGKQLPSYFVIKRLAEIWDIDLNMIKNKHEFHHAYFD